MALSLRSCVFRRNSLFKQLTYLNNVTITRTLASVSNSRLTDARTTTTTTTSATITPLTQQTTIKPRGIVTERGYFDTHSLIKELTHNGFTQDQAESLCKLFKEITGYIVQDFKNECVTKVGMELAIQQVMVHIASLKKDMIILEKSEFSTLRNENEKIMIELKNLRDQMQDEIIKLKSGFTLDLNLEKSRVTETESQISVQHQRLESRIDTEAANLRTIFEKHKADLIKWALGMIISMLTIGLGIWRLLI